MPTACTGWVQSSSCAPPTRHGLGVRLLVMGLTLSPLPLVEPLAWFAARVSEMAPRRPVVAAYEARLPFET